MTLVMVRCKRCGEPVGLTGIGAHRAGRAKRGGWYVHTDTGLVRCRVAVKRWWGIATPDVDRLVRDTVAALWQDRPDAASTGVRELLDGELYELLDRAGRLDEIQWQVEWRDISRRVGGNSGGASGGHRE